MKKFEKPDFTLDGDQIKLLNETIYSGINQHLIVDWGSCFGPPVVDAGFGYYDKEGTKLLLKMRQYYESADKFFDHYDVWFESGRNENGERCLSVMYLPSAINLGKYSISNGQAYFNAFIGRMESFGYLPKMDVFLPLEIRCLDENGDLYTVDSRPHIELKINKDTGEKTVKKHFAAVGYVSESFGNNSGLYFATKDDNGPVKVVGLTPTNKKATINNTYTLTSGSWGNEQFEIESAGERILPGTLFMAAIERFDNLAESIEILSDSFAKGKKKGNILERKPNSKLS